MLNFIFYIVKSYFFFLGVDPQSDAIRQAVESLTANQNENQKEEGKDEDKKEKK